MKLETLGQFGLDYAPCQYGLSRLYFRGPRKSLDGDYVACIGGNETYGRFLATTFTDLMQIQLGRTCVNFGCVNAGIDAYIRDSAMMAACHDAAAVVVQVMGAQNQSNRFYTVHPRRNDRFLRPTAALVTLYPDVDFANFTFTRHMLAVLLLTSPERFELVREELQAQWMHSMQSLLAEIRGPALLLWMAEHAPDDEETIMRSDPLFVSRNMLNEISALTQGYVEIVPSQADLASGAEALIYGPAEAHSAAQMLGLTAHETAAEQMCAVLNTMI